MFELWSVGSTNCQLIQPYDEGKSCWALMEWSIKLLVSRPTAALSHVGCATGLVDGC